MRPLSIRVLAVASCLALAGAAQAAVNAPVLKWEGKGCFASWCQTGWYSSPAVADVDNDGQMDVVWGSYDTVAVRGDTGALKWRASSGDRVWPGVAVADLTGDGILEVIVGRSSDTLTVYDARNGNVLWTRHPFGSGEIRTLAVEDLDNDGKLEIIVGRASGGSNNQLNVFDYAGNVRPGWPARRNGEAGYGWGMYNENVTVGDLNGDGLKEIIGPTDTHYITALDRNGNQLPAHSMFGAGKVWSQVGVHVSEFFDLRGYADCDSGSPQINNLRPNFANTAPAIGDVDGDGTNEIVVVGDVYDCSIGDDFFGDQYHMPWIFRMDRRRWAGSGFDWTVIPTPAPNARPLSEDYGVIQNSVQDTVLADLDGDGKKEILFSSYDGRVHAFWLDKTQHGSWPYVVPGAGFHFAGEPVVADLDNDGHAEVIFTSWPENNAGTGQLHILDYLGNQLYAVDLPAGEDWNGGLAAPTLANIDGDTDLEVVIGTVSSGIVAYDLPGTASARILWGTGRGNYKRTGVAPVATVSFSLSTTTVGEGAGSIVVSAKVLRSDGNPITTAASASYATANGSATAPGDYTTRTGTLNIPVGTASGALLPVTTIPIIDDALGEGNQSFSIGMSAFTNVSAGAYTTETITIADNEAGPPTSEVYRLRHPSVGAYLFTLYPTERDAAVAQYGYVYEGICCRWYTSNAADGRLAMYRLFSGTAGEYFFTISAAERDAAANLYGYTYEGVAAYAFPSNVAPAPTPWYRLRYGNKHLYTIYPAERDAAVSQYGYTYEGVSCYLPPP